MTISLSIKQAIVKEAALAGEEECCGFVVNGDIVPCNNVHTDKLNNFAIDAIDYAKADDMGTIEAVYHSHVDGARGFSLHDVKSCKQSNIPWIVYYKPKSEFFYADPTGAAPYEERQWIYGIHDCYALVRDFYMREFGIQLDDFERGEELEWQKTEWTMFADNYEKQGFLPIDFPSQKGDVVLMQIGAPSPNHVGVVAGDGACFYHHLMGRLSEKNVYGGYWAKVTTRVLRHKDL